MHSIMKTATRTQGTAKEQSGSRCHLGRISQANKINKICAVLILVSQCVVKDVPLFGSTMLATAEQSINHSLRQGSASRSSLRRRAGELQPIDDTVDLLLDNEYDINFVDTIEGALSSDSYGSNSIEEVEGIEGKEPDFDQIVELDDVDADDMFDLLQEDVSNGLAAVESDDNNPTIPQEMDSVAIGDMANSTGRNTERPTPFFSFLPTDEPTATDEPTVERVEGDIVFEPVPSPANAPTSGPSALPTRIPTPFPTMAPTPSPSALPTRFPTLFPSASPTPECHDKKSYQSPINGLGCEQHRGSNCDNWSHIGLNEWQIVELHRDCPVACGTDCEPYTLSPSAAPSAAPTSAPTRPLKEVFAFLELYLYNAPDTMTPEIQATFEDTLFLYFQSALDGSSDMITVEISDQGSIGNSEVDGGNDEGRTRKTRIRFLAEEESNVNLKVKIVAEATTRHLDSAMFKAVLQGAINDADALSAVLIEANDYFVGVMFSNELISELNSVDEEEDKPSNKTPTAAIVISSIGIIALGGVLTGHYYFHRHYSGGSKVRADEEDGGLQPALSDLKGDENIFSFEESPVYRVKPNVPTMKAKGLLPQQSHTTASRSESSENNSLPMKMADDQGIIHSPPNSPENLLAGIPPMIVIDNIDRSGSEEEEERHDDININDHETNDDAIPSPPKESPPSRSLSSKKKVSSLPKADKNGIPIRRIEASYAIARALSNKSGSVIPDGDSLTLMEMISSVKSIEDDDSQSPISRCLSPRFEKLWNDGESSDESIVFEKSKSQIEQAKALTRSNSAGQNLSSSDNAQENMDDKRFDENSGRNDVAQSVKNLRDSTPPNKIGRGINKIVTSLTQFSSHNQIQKDKNHEESNEKANVASAEERTDHAVSVASSDCESEARDTLELSSKPNLFTMSMAKFERKMAKISISNKFQGSREEIFVLDARDASEVDERDTEDPKTMTRSLSDSPLRTAVSVPSMSSAVGLSPQKEMKTNYSSLSPMSETEKGGITTSPPTTSSTNPNRFSSLKRKAWQRSSTSGSEANGYRYIFGAPSKGKLGIVIQKTVVHVVKDYSPLFGMVEPGDKIIEIDDVKTDNMTTGEITSILASKRGKNKAKMIRLTIVSLTEKKGLKTYCEENDNVLSAVVAPLENEKKKHVTITDDAPISHVYLHQTGSYDELEASSRPRYSDVGDNQCDKNGDGNNGKVDEDGISGFHLLGACPRSEDEEDVDEGDPMQLIGSTYSLNEQTDLQEKSNKLVSSSTSNERMDGRDGSENFEIAMDSHMMIIMQAGSQSSDEASVDFEM